MHRADVENHSEAIFRHLVDFSHCFARAALETGSLTPFLNASPVEAALPVVCLKTRRVHAAPSECIVKTDRNDAMGVAE